MHCAAGVSRSPSVVIAYMMVRQGLSYCDACSAVKAARPVAAPNHGFVLQLGLFEEAGCSTEGWRPWSIGRFRQVGGEGAGAGERARGGGSRPAGGAVPPGSGVHARAWAHAHARAPFGGWEGCNQRVYLQLHVCQRGQPTLLPVKAHHPQKQERPSCPMGLGLVGKGPRGARRGAGLGHGSAMT